MREIAVVFVLLAFLAHSAMGEEMVFFADDLYKAAATPELHASLVDPAVAPGGSTALKIVVANSGRVLALLPTGIQGSSLEASREMQEELRSVDALNVVATLTAKDPVSVLSGPATIPLLPSGTAQPVEFLVQVGEGAEGPYHLDLRLDYEHQIDVRISAGQASPLYVPANVSEEITIHAGGSRESFRADYARSELWPGENGTLTLVIRNLAGPAGNCSARLLAAPPFRASDQPVSLGYMQPGDLALATFWVEVGDNASVRQYQMACQVLQDGESSAWSSTIPLTVAVEEGQSIQIWLVPLPLILALAFLAWRWWQG
ncbi:MAG: hypothetical protein GKC10_05985, partial [Methanosarcinales archaeon]|nr:hypothetical protein [Methanosarcinales archaeon]